MSLVIPVIVGFEQVGKDIHYKVIRQDKEKGVETVLIDLKFKINEDDSIMDEEKVAEQIRKSILVKYAVALSVDHYILDKNNRLDQHVDTFDDLALEHGWEFQPLQEYKIEE